MEHVTERIAAQVMGLAKGCPHCGGRWHKGCCRRYKIVYIGSQWQSKRKLVTYSCSEYHRCLEAGAEGAWTLEWGLSADLSISCVGKRTSDLWDCFAAKDDGLRVNG